MGLVGSVFRLALLGSFRLTAPDGSRIIVTAKRSRILLAMLATARSRERSRLWLQERLWGSRERCNSQASLRRELSNFRQLINPVGGELLIIERDAVAINADCIDVDIWDPVRVASSRDDFLEGIDIAWEEGFEDWLREERQALQAIREEMRSTIGVTPLMMKEGSSSMSQSATRYTFGGIHPADHALLNVSRGRHLGP